VEIKEGDTTIKKWQCPGMAIPVVEFSRKGYKISKVFG
jgi:hypothetical protein